MGYTHGTTVDSKTRICTKCNTEYPNTNEYFCYANKKIGRLESVCKECKKVIGKEKRDAIRKKNRINWETADSFINDYFASKAGINKFLDDKDIKGSLKSEIERTAKADPSMTLDDFISDEFSVDGIDGLAKELGIDTEYIKKYFSDLGF